MLVCSNSSISHAAVGRETGFDPNCSFLFSSHKETLRAEGVRHVLDVPSVDDLPEAVADYFRSRPVSGECKTVVGMLPFRRDRKPHLVEPLALHRSTCSPDSLPRPSAAVMGRCTISEVPSRVQYRQMVEQALKMMGDSEPLRKVVLSRALQLTAGTLINVSALIARLARDRHSTTFAVKLPGDDAGILLGATPELLVQKRGNRFVSVPLAGSARRRVNSNEDKSVAEALLHSEKDRREHASVVDSIVEALAPYCRHIRAARIPTVMPTATMWHLGTHIEGEIRDDSITSLHLAAALHPTAAVCGQPREIAAAAIEQLESFERGFFTGAVGWCDSAGDGQWMVTIRCAEVHGNRARLYAGAGIVTGSDPEAEAAETSAKFQTLLRAMGIDETGRALDEAAA